MGVSVENQAYTFRIDLLRQTGAKVKFLSLEPLLGPLSSLDLRGIDWVIVGGESGPKARPLKESWVLDTRGSATKRGPLSFSSKLGGTKYGVGVKKQEGSDPWEMPHDFRIREYPRIASSQ